MSSRLRYIDLLCRGVVKGVVVFTQRPVLVRGGELRWKGPCGVDADGVCFEQPISRTGVW